MRTNFAKYRVQYRYKVPAKLLRDKFNFILYIVKKLNGEGDYDGKLDNLINSLNPNMGADHNINMSRGLYLKYKKMMEVFNCR